VGQLVGKRGIRLRGDVGGKEAESTGKNGR